MDSYVLRMVVTPRGISHPCIILPVLPNAFTYSINIWDMNEGWWWCGAIVQEYFPLSFWPSFICPWCSLFHMNRDFTTVTSVVTDVVINAMQVAVTSTAGCRSWNWSCTLRAGLTSHASSALGCLLSSALSCLLISIQKRKYWVEQSVHIAHALIEQQSNENAQSIRKYITLWTRWNLYL